MSKLNPSTDFKQFNINVTKVTDEIDNDVTTVILNEAQPTAKLQRINSLNLTLKIKLCLLETESHSSKNSHSFSSFTLPIAIKNINRSTAAIELLHSFFVLICGFVHSTALALVAAEAVA